MVRRRSRVRFPIGAQARPHRRRPAANAPPGARVIAVEQEPTTARIAAALHPEATVRCESFADTTLAALPGAAPVDLVVGNVPFGKVALHDRRYNRANRVIHNHFVIKSLHLTRPGGLVVVLTSRFTLDARDPAARREIAALGDLTVGRPQLG